MTQGFAFLLGRQVLSVVELNQMASSESMEDSSFRARVDKIFGSLSSAQSSSVSRASLWSLTDDEVEKREWNRNKGEAPNRDDATLCASSYDRLFKKDRQSLRSNSIDIRKELEIDLEHLDDDDDDEEEEENDISSKQQLTCGDSDELEIRASIGLDCTLDYEEEEDEYDKIAEGRENSGDRVYMSDISSHGQYVNSKTLPPNSIHYLHRDPRANHLAAQVRLKEDEVVAKKIESDCSKSMLISEKPCIKISEDGCKLKSVLKRKVNAEVVKPSKRVSFDPTCKDNCEGRIQHQDQLASIETKASDEDCLAPGNMHHVPDYLLNPSKFTRYSFDSSSDIDEASNSQACMDFLEQVKRSKSIMFEGMLEDTSANLPNSVTFIPRKKASETEMLASSSEEKQNQNDGSCHSLTQTGFPIGIAAGEAQHVEVHPMDEDEAEAGTANGFSGFLKPGRHYRVKSRKEDPIS